jgi:hypothetical protein
VVLPLNILILGGAALDKADLYQYAMLCLTLLVINALVAFHGLPADGTPATDHDG